MTQAWMQAHLSSLDCHFLRLTHLKPQSDEFGFQNVPKKMLLVDVAFNLGDDFLNGVGLTVPSAFTGQGAAFVHCGGRIVQSTLP